MNPPTSQPGRSSGQTIVVGGGTGSSGVQFHTHPASAIVSGTLDDDLMPGRLAPIPAAVVANADQQVESGWWAAGPGTANMPAASSWVAETIRWPENSIGFYSVQVAYETTGPYRVYRRNLEIFYGAWERIDRGFYDTRYQLVSDIDFQQVAQSGAVTPNGGTNSTLTGLSVTVTSPGTSAVYAVEIDADVTFAGAQTNIIELLVDGAAETAQLISGANATGYRIDGHKKWRITGLAAGSRTFTARTRNTGAGTNATVNLTHTLMTVTRVS